MDTEIIEFTILVFVCILVITCWAIYSFIEKKVKKASTRYKALEKINKEFDFHNDVQTTYKWDEYVQTKPKFDKFNFEKYICTQIERNNGIYESIINKIEENRRTYEQYKNEINVLPKLSSRPTAKKVGVPYILFNNVEKKLVNKTIQKPVLSTSIICTINYRSPKGRNSYQKRWIYSYEDIYTGCERVQKQVEQRNSNQHQRRLMTDSLRYDILKRDKFRCVLCGRSADDGIQLQVDHIVPVSKGGKSVPSNLRTLCSSCNMGKSDKYDKDGVN